MDANNKPTLKKIVAQTNDEFVREFRSWIPLLGTVISVVFSIAILVLCFDVNKLFGFVMMPALVVGNFWLIRFFNNIKYYWR